MEKKNGLIVLIIILSILVIGLSGFIIYDKVLSNNKSENKIIENNNNQENNDEQILVTLPEQEAKEIIETRTEIANDFFERYNTYCGPDGSILDNEIIIDNNDNFAYYSINNYNTFSELEDYLLQFITKDTLYSNEYYDQNNYIEKNNKLYCKVLPKGGTSVTYGDINIESIEQNEIKATIDSTLTNPGDEPIKVKIIIII